MSQLIAYTANAAGAGLIFLLAGLVGRVVWEHIKERR